MVVYHIDKFVKKCPAEYKLSAIYVIDSICKTSRDKMKTNLYTPRFEKVIPGLMDSLKKAPSKDIVTFFFFFFFFLF